MRRFFKALPIALLVAIGAAVLGSGGLPPSRTLERALVVDATPGEVYAHLARIGAWRGWYVGPKTGHTEGPALGAGGILVVEDEEDRELRRLELTETSSPSFVAYRFPDADQMPYDVEGSFTLEPLEAGTRVLSQQKLASRAPDDAWMARTGERWFLYAFADRFVGSILERELHNLKARVEGQPPPGARELPPAVQ